MAVDIDERVIKLLFGNVLEVDLELFILEDVAEVEELKRLSISG